MKKTLSIMISSILVFILVCVLIPETIIGESGYKAVPAGGNSFEEVGYLYEGSTVIYDWYCTDNSNDVDFSITDSYYNYEEVYSTDGSSGYFSVPNDGTYSLKWYSGNSIWDADLYYEYSITQPTVSGELTVKYSFSKNPCEQGESSSLMIDITNPNDDQIKLTWIGIHFDWDPKDDVYTIDSNVKNNPKILASGQKHSSTISFSIEKDTTLGDHVYDIRINYELKAYGNWHNEYWYSGDKLDFNVIEKDRDGDGTPDSDDAFPDNPSESKDTDEDGLGDNSDAFPTDPLEHLDTDGDGIGDNADKS